MLPAPLWGLDSIWTMNPESPVHGLSERLQSRVHVPSRSTKPLERFARSIVRDRPQNHRTNPGGQPLPCVHPGALAFYYQFRGELRSAIETAERAVALDPNEMVSRGALGWSLRLVGRADEAAQEIKAMMRLSPQAPDWVVISLGDSYLIAGSPAEALTIFEAVLGRPPTSPGNEAWARLMKALALDALGREEEARDQIARSVEVYPARTISFMRLSYQFDDPARFEPWAETWRRLGLPE